MTAWSDVSLLSSIKYQVEWQSLSTFATMLRIQSPGGASESATFD